MSIFSGLRRDAQAIPAGAERAPGDPWTNPATVREVRHYGVRPGQRADRLSGSLLWLSGLTIAASLGGAAYVAYTAQRAFAFAHDYGDWGRALVLAGLPDAGWISMSAVALVAALRGRSSMRARAGVLLFFGLSLAAQLAYAPHDPGGYLVAVIAPITLAWMLESFVVELRRWSAHHLGVQIAETPILSALAVTAKAIILAAGGVALWGLRLGLDPRGTGGGLRRWVLETAPVAPGRRVTALSGPTARPVLPTGSITFAVTGPRGITVTRPEQRTGACSCGCGADNSADNGLDKSDELSVTAAVRRLLDAGLTSRSAVIMGVCDLLGEAANADTVDRIRRRELAKTTS